MKLSKIDFSLKNILFYVLGVLTIGFGVHLMLLSELGAGAWDTPSANGEVFFNLILGWNFVSLGLLSVIINTTILLMIIIYRKDLKYLITLIPILIMGSVLDLWDFLLFYNLEISNMIIQVLFYCLGALILPFGLVLVVKSKFPAFVFEEWTFMLQEITKMSFQKVRIGIEFIGVFIGTIFALLTYFNTSDSSITMFGQVGVGTIILALTIGPLIQMYMKVLGVKNDDK